MTEIGPGCRESWDPHVIHFRVGKFETSEGCYLSDISRGKGFQIGLPQKTAILTRRSDWPNGPAARSSQRCGLINGPIRGVKYMARGRARPD